MQVPLEVSFRNVDKSESLEALVEKEAAKLEKIHGNMTSCRLAVEMPHKSQQGGSPYRIRIEIRVPSGNEIVVSHGPGDSDMHEPLQSVLRAAFDSARRQLKKLRERQRGEVKSHPEQQMSAVVQKLFPKERYGFLETLDGQQIYFQENSVLHKDFDRLQIGTGVRFVAQPGNKGLQASTVQIVDKPGSGS